MAQTLESCRASWHKVCPNVSENVLVLDLDAAWSEKNGYEAQIMTHEDFHAHNSIEKPENVKPYQVTGSLAEGLKLPAYSFAVVRI